MASVIGKVSAVFTASTSGLTSGVNQASRAMSSMEREVARLRSGMSTLVAINGVQLFGSIVSVASRAISSFTAVAQAQAQVIDTTSKLAARLGMTYGDLAGLSYAGDLAGVSMETIGAAATKADVAFVKAANGSKQANAAFAALGLSVADLENLNAADRFDAIATAIASIPNEAERSAAAIQVFGRSGAQLLPLFSGGAEGIRQAREEAEKFGLALTSAQGQDVEAMNDAFTRAQKAIEGIVNQVVAYLSPAVKTVVDTFSNFIAQAGGANIGRSIGEYILAGARGLATVADYVVKNFSGVFAFFGEVASNVGTILLSSAASLASVIPGMEKETAKMQAALINMQGGLPTFAAEAAGPIAAALDDAIATARESAAQIEQAKPAPVPEIKQVVQVAGITEAIKAADSRSKEGVAEMFRLMRTNPNDVQEQQLAALEEIAANTAASDEPPWAVEF